ncbi:MAG: SCO family protein [Planctomycetales bacterium]
MSIAVKAWLTVGMIALVGYTGFSVLRIAKERRARPVASNAVRPEQSIITAQSVDLGSFSMTAQDGEPFKFQQLNGKVWIANLFFSNCAYLCRDLSNKVAELHRDPDFDDVQFVSITVDPTIDTPLVLARSAREYKADTSQWVFLNGEMHEVERFGKQVKVSVRPKTHSPRLLLFDRQGVLQDYYLFNEAEDIDRLREKVKALKAEQMDGDDSRNKKNGTSASQS